MHRHFSFSLKAFLLFIVIASLIYIPACNRKSDEKRLTIAVVSGVEGDALTEAAKDYEKQTGVKINIAQFPYQNLFEKELIDLQSKTGAYDLIMLDDPWFPKFASLNAMNELTPFFQKKNLQGADEDFVKTSLALCRNPYESGKLFALPYVGNAQLFFYRKDLFEKHNLKQPQTWDDVLSAAKTISEKESAGAPNGGKVHGYVMRAAQGNSAVADFMPIFWAYGAEMFDANGNPTVNSVEGIAALKMMLELGKYSPSGYASFGADEVSNHLLQGTAAMSINWPAWISAFGSESKSKVIGKMEFTTMPGGKNQGKSEIGNWLIAIPQAARNKDAAFEFLVWATSREQMKLSAERGNPPTRTSLFKDESLLKKYPAYPAQLKSLEASRPRPRTPLWNEIEMVFGTFLSKANSGQLTAEEAMNQANEEIKKIVERGR